MKDGIMERAAGSRFSTIFAMLDRARGADEVLRVIDAAFGEPEEPKELSVPTPLFDQLVAGMFNSLHWRRFGQIVSRIYYEEGKSMEDMREPILDYLIKNAPEGGYPIYRAS